MKKAISFSEFKLNERENVSTGKGCLMCYFKGNEDGWNKTVSDMIEPDDIHEGEGLEDEPHTTILYGFNHDDVNEDEHNDKLSVDVKDNGFTPDMNDIKFDENLSLFENEEFDVLKLGLKSDKLSKANTHFKENYKYENDYDKYEPHVTVGYLKSGTGKKYTSKENTKLIKESLFSSTSVGMIYSYPNSISKNSQFTII